MILFMCHSGKAKTLETENRSVGVIKNKEYLKHFYIMITKYSIPDEIVEQWLLEASVEGGEQGM